MDRPRLFVLVSEVVRQRCLQFIAREAPEGVEVLIAPPRMTGGQMRLFRAICSDVEASGLKWKGEARSAQQWAVLFKSGHAVVSGAPVDVIEGLEGEIVNTLESTKEMSKARGSSLVEYALSWAVNNGVRLRDPAPSRSEQPGAQSRRGDTDRHGHAR